LLKKLLLLLIPLAALVLWLLARNAAPPEVAFAPVTTERLVDTLTTNGRVEPFESRIIRSETVGAVERIHVERGQNVTQGQLLVSLNSAQAESELASARSRVSQAKAELQVLSQGGTAPELAEIESGIAKARAELETAQREVETLRRLIDKKAATKAELDVAQASVQRAELQIQSLERRRASLVSPPDRTASEARLQEAQAGAAAASRRIALSQIRSPMTGVLYALDVKPGAYVNPGDVIGSVGLLDRLRVTVFVDEPELGRVAQGMPVTITWDAMPGRKWNGFVEKVPLQVVPLGTRQVGEVICTIDNPERSLIPGTNVNAEIRSRVVEAALTVPKEALRRENNETGVLKLDGDRVRWQPVKLGISSVTRAQVVSGLAGGDRVALPGDIALKDGQQVRPAE
jgi:HlyD family secretion protein